MLYVDRAVVAEWAKELPQIQVEAHRRSQVQILLGDVCHPPPLPFLQYSIIPHLQNPVFNKHWVYLKYIKALF